MSEIPDQRNWYKLSTILLSGATVILGLLSLLSFRDVNQRGQLIKSIDAKIDQLQTRADKISHTPQVQVVLTSLKSSGLPAAAFSTISEVPAVLTVRHVSGETAQGISVRVNSKSRITKIIPGECLDPSEYHLQDDGMSVVFYIPRLRKGSIFDATIMQNGLNDIGEITSIDVGTIMSTDKIQTFADIRRSVDTLELSKIIGNMSKFITLPRVNSVDDIDKLNILEFNDVNQITTMIDELNTFKSEIRSGQLFNISYDMLTYLCVVMILAGLFIMYDLVKYLSKKRIKTALNGNRIVEGLSEAVALKALGTYGREICCVTDCLESSNKIWIYGPSRSFILHRQLPGVAIYFSDEKVIHVTPLYRQK
jgi:hypothetical protein